MEGLSNNDIPFVFRPLIFIYSSIDRRYSVAPQLFLLTTILWSQLGHAVKNVFQKIRKEPWWASHFIFIGFNHLLQILVAIVLLEKSWGFLSSLDKLIRGQVAKQEEKSSRVVFLTLFSLTSILAIVCYFYGTHGIYRQLLLIPPPLRLVTRFHQVVIYTLGADVLAKTFTMLVKVILVSMPGWVVQYKYRGNIFQVIEYSSQLYRGLLPVVVYAVYLDGELQKEPSPLIIVSSFVYIYSKVSFDLTRRILKLCNVVVSIYQSPQSDKTDHQQVDAIKKCPICWEVMNQITRLNCSHEFCEKCLATWFSRLEVKTCPMCRMIVITDFRDGATLMEKILL